MLYKKIMWNYNIEFYILVLMIYGNFVYFVLKVVLVKINNQYNNEK